MTSRGRIIAAALATAVAGAAVMAFAAGEAPAPRGQIVRPVDSLPWSAVLLHGQPVSALTRPAAVLYVLPTCEHCDAAAVAFAREARQAGLHGLIISASGQAAAEQYRRRFNLPPLATDSALEFARAAGITMVPVLGRPAGEGLMALAPLSSPSLIRYYLRTNR